MSAEIKEEVTSVVLAFVECGNRGDLQGAADLHGDDLVFHMPGMPAMNKPAWEQFNQQWFGAFPDLHIEVDPSTMTVQEDRAAGYYTLTGTHTGDFMGIPATGRRISVTGVNLFRVRDGKIVEEWVSNDSLGMMQQLGLVPAPGAGQP
jgi:steroid delta-isomerase-like uncharacterized protein